jgi:diguanylate cyclase (GGDEF)-like protein
MPKDDIPSRSPTDLVQEITRLKKAYEVVSQQVKQLVKTESKLYTYQEKLDAQANEYKALYELSKKLHTTIDVSTLFENTINYVIYQLGYERVLIFRQVENSGAYAVSALGGYYNDQERLEVEALTLNQDAPLLEPFMAGAEFLICKADTEQEPQALYRAKLHMDEYLLYPLGSPVRARAILAVGNCAENAAFYRRVTDGEGALLGMGNLVGLLTSSIENYIFYAHMEKAKDELQMAHDELEARVRRRTSELSLANEHLHQKNIETSVLYQVSSVISRSISMDELVKGVLQTISELELFNTDKGGIFIVDGDRMKMTGNVGHSAAFVDLHKEMKVGDCLCGIVAKTGEPLISKNSAKDSRHTITDSHTAAHGHLIIPLKTKDRVEGVLDLYTAVDAEIDDYKVKLLLAIGSQLGIAIENAKLYERTKELSLRDSLTGLWNHEEILRILGRELTRGEREERPVSVIMADLDHFKKVNDVYGHMAGDAVLRTAASRMFSLCRSYDAVGRYGGEEFIIVLPGSDEKSAVKIAERLRKMIGDELIETPVEMIAVTMSLGVATSSNEKRRDAKSHINAADRALYRAKDNGRNRVEFAFSDE